MEAQGCNLLEVPKLENGEFTPDPPFPMDMAISVFLWQWLPMKTLIPSFFGTERVFLEYSRLSFPSDFLLWIRGLYLNSETFQDVFIFWSFSKFLLSRLISNFASFGIRLFPEFTILSNNAKLGHASLNALFLGQTPYPDLVCDVKNLGHLWD